MSKSSFKFRSIFDHADPSIDFSKSPSMTRQEFAAEANINNVLKRYATTGWLVDPNSPRNNRKPQWDDYSKLLDYQDSLNLVIDAQDRFDALPVEIRERFNYDPAKLLVFLQKASEDTKGPAYEEAVKLRLITPKEPQKAAAAATPVSEPQSSHEPAQPAEQPAQSAGANQQKA